MSFAIEQVRKITRVAMRESIKEMHLGETMRKEDKIRKKNCKNILIARQAMQDYIKRTKQFKFEDLIKRSGGNRIQDGYFNKTVQ